MGPHTKKHARRAQSPVEVVAEPKSLKLRRSSKKTPQPNKTVSAAGIFKKRGKDVTGAPQSGKERSHKARKSHRSQSFESDREETLSRSVKIGIEQARRAIDINLSDAFDSTYNDLVHQLEAGKTKEDMFSSKITEMAKTLSAPLEEEKISTTFNRDGQRIQQTVEIGKKMVQFKKNVAKDKKRLDENWKQWDELQSEFEEFGMEVFGKECFPAASAHPQQLRRGQEGFKHEMELLDLEHSTKSSEILAEIEGIVIETTQKKDAQEEEHKGALQVEQRNILKVLMLVF